MDDFGWPRNPDGYNKLVKRVAQKAGISDIHPHMFRHTFVSLPNGAHWENEYVAYFSDKVIVILPDNDGAGRGYAKAALKARDISACMRMLRDRYDCHVPDDFNALLTLPGVGRKSANLIIGDVFGKPAIVTDTHCIRLCNRIGLVDNVKEPAKVERELWKIIPPAEGNGFCHRLVDHGRAVCTARTKPYCDKCCLADVCRARKEFLHE